MNLSLLKQVRYGRLARSQVVIFDAVGSEFIEQLILREINYTILPARKEVIYLSPVLSAIFLKNLVWIYLFYRKYRGIYLAYLLSCIEYIKPQTVITFIDNNSLFHAISEIYDKAEFYAIQNGIRTKYSIGKPLSAKGNGIVYSRVNLFCFGQYEIDLYKSNGFMVNRFYPVGSLVGGYYRSRFRPHLHKYDLCLVSQWRQILMLTEEYPTMKDAIITLDNHLQKFVAEREVSLCIARATEDPRELSYFREKYGKQAVIIDFNRKDLSTYIAMDSSGVVLTFFSSAAYESFGWGKKVLFCNFSGDPNYNFPKENICSLNDPNYNAFERRLDLFLKIDQEEYLRLIKDVSRYVMSYDSNIPVHTFIREKVTEAI